MSGVLKLDNTSVSRGDRQLFAGLSCAIDAGEIVAVLGPNGAGKSSLLLAIAGLIPAQGAIEISGRNIGAFSKQQLMQQVAWQGELPPTEFGLTVAQRLALAAGENGDRIPAIAEAMDIALLLHRPLGELSSGERQRTELAALSLRDAPLWLLDEPTAHLDLKHQIACIRMMRAERKLGRAIVTVLHDLQQAIAVADHVILVDGKGGAIYGRAEVLFGSERLSTLFDAGVIREGNVLVPDYGGAE